MAPGTAANRARQAKVYVHFALMYKVNYLSPSRLHAAMYVQYLANTYKAISTVKNYVSGARYWIIHHRGDDSSFASFYVTSVVKYNASKSTHVPFKAPPLTVNHLAIVSKFFDSNPNIPPVFKAALLIGYACFLRSSNLLSPTVQQWGGPHTLSVSDILSVPNGLVVCIRSSKTIRIGKPVLLSVFPVSKTLCCPVAAWHRYLAISRPAVSGPAFMINSVTPLTARPLVNFIRLALQAAGEPLYNRFSLHSIRRGAAQAAQKAGADRLSLKHHGTWASDTGLNAYLN